MAGMLQNRKTLAFITATVACAALVSFVLVHPKPVSDPLLGGGWQCSKTMFVTSCTRIDRNVPIARSLSIAPIVFRRR
jgi:hypothetical protein